jgi:RNA polymerase sigma-70 factor, ECF subfamily
MGLKKKIPDRPDSVTGELDLNKVIARAKKGDERSLEVLIDLTKIRLFRFCYHLSGSRSTAEDIAQETYIKALANLDGIPKGEGIFSWLFRVAKNHYIDQIRSAEGKLKQREFATVGPENDDVLEGISAENEKDIQVVFEVRRALSKLSDEDRMAILLIDHEEYSYEEAADIMGVSRAALRSRLQRARAKFLEEYKKNE